MPADAVARGAWWTVFGDAELNALETRVDVSNQTVKKALADLQQARAMVDYQHAGFLPTITAGVAQSRARVSQNRLGSSLAGKTTPDYQAGVAASWPTYSGACAMRWRARRRTPPRARPTCRP